MAIVNTYAQTSDSLKLQLQPEGDNPFNQPTQSNLNLKDPSNIKTEVEYNPENNKYEFKQSIGEDGGIQYRPNASMGLNDYLDYSMEQSLNEYWNQKAKEQSFSQQKGNKPELDIKNETVDRIFGGSEVDIRPNGQAQLTFGIQHNRNQNPVIPVRNQKTTNFDFDMKIQLNVVGKIGEKLKLTTNYNTESTFDWQNQMKLEYTGFEDEIIKKIEAGNVSFPLKSSLITGNQSLFGIKSEMQFGKLYVTSILSSQKGRKSSIEIQGGAQVNEFEVKADQYEQNKHFFLAHHFRDHYEQWVENPTAITSPVNITRVEVWVTNINTATDDTRNIIAFQDLGEENSAHYYNPAIVYNYLGANYPDNNANNLYDTLAKNTNIRSFNNASGVLTLDYQMTSKRDYQKVELARKLDENEYTFHPQLGYISLRQEINTNQVLAVAYQYTYRGEVYQVGEFSNQIQGQETLLLKMLKSTERNSRIPMWDLMMKNIYSIGAYNVQRDGFQLDLWYLNAKTGIDNNYISIPNGRGGSDNVQLIRLLNLDSLDINQNPHPDGVFDYIEDVTIVSSNGRLIFPVLEPFGGYLRSLFPNQADADKYAFDSLYTTTQENAKVKYPEKNRFTIKGKTKSSSGSEISLGALNIPQGSVVVTQGGRPLTENVDYLVDYQIGRVTIINQSIMESGTPIKVSLESQDLFGIQSKTLMGSRFDYTLSEDIMLGGTIMRLTERPITFKTNYGDEPMSNTVMGVDGSYKKESQFLTNLIDKLPLIETKEKSVITANAEAAKLIPGHSRALSDEGTSYIDDFEGSQTSINLSGGAISQWVMASTPQGQPELFKEGDLVNDLAFNFNRARLSWYVIDPIFWRPNTNTPDYIKNDADMRSNHFMRVVWQQEVFPNKSLNYNSPNNISMFDLAYYPSERGQYNYDVDGFSTKGTKYGFGINEDGSLKNPDQRWGGIMRKLETNDFDAANVQFIQFWLMDPFAEAGSEGFPDSSLSGQLYFNIGQISEDILRDGRKSFEQGLPATEEESKISLSDSSNITVFGRIPASGTQAIVHTFNNDNNSRQFQDVGMEGLRDEEERTFFEKVFLSKIKSIFSSTSKAYIDAEKDPSSDNYHHFRGDDFDKEKNNILDRYKAYNGMEGNSPTSEQSKELNQAGYPTSQSTRPNEEDINLDNTLDEVESYYQYRININKTEVNPANVGSNYITNVLQTTAATEDGRNRPVKWYQFKIPIEDFEKAVGGINDFRSMRFMRIYVKGFEQPVFLRFAQLELVRGEWRKYAENIDAPGAYLPVDEVSEFNIAAVNIEENSSKTPVNYVLPPGLRREISSATTNLQLMNEQSMSMQVCDLKDGEARAAYKSMNVDVRSYKKLKMYIHAEARNNEPLNDDEITAFIRFGADYNNNYYEYEIPLKITSPGYYDGNVESDQKGVWPELNNIEILFKDLFELKVERNRKILDNTGEVTIYNKYSKQIGNAVASILGNPNISTIKTVMIGIKNPKNDGLTKCAEIWVNELRLTDFDEFSGYAAIGRVNAKLADFANVALTGSISTPGWGTLENKISERQREKVEAFDAATTVQLGKLLPEEAGVKLPMYVGYSVNRITPQYAPQANDVPTADYEKLMKEAGYKLDSIQQASRDVTKRKSINFANIRKEKSKKNADKKNHFYDISNWTGTYAYTEQDHHNFDLEKDKLVNHKGGLTYSFNNNPKAVEPFKKTKALNSKYLKLIKDFNFYLLPKQFGVRTDVNRMYNERLMRNNVPGTLPLDPFVNKSFNFNRAYNLKYDLSKALTLDFNATNNSLVREPEGIVNPESTDTSYTYWKQQVWDQLMKLGTTTNYHHNTNLNYTLPLSKIPFTNWISSSIRYTSSYTWQRRSFAQESWGNTIQNTQGINGNATMNMLTLYNKSDYLKKVNQKFKKNSNKRKSSKPTKGKKEDDKKNKDDITITDRFFKLLMSTKSINANYTLTNGILLPGYNDSTTYIGMSKYFQGPSLGFIFGQQHHWNDKNDISFAQYAEQNNWLVTDSTLNKRYSETFNERLSINATLEPLNDMRIQIKTNYQYATQTGYYYRYQGNFYQGDEPWQMESITETGNFSASYITWKTAFGHDNDSLFTTFLSNRETISNRLNTGQHDLDTTYSYGYGSTSPYVLIPAFLATYSGTNPNDVSLDPFNVGIKGQKYLPLPNWQVRYSGLSKIEKLRTVFKTVTLNHQYQSTYAIGSFTRNVNYEHVSGNEKMPTAIDTLSHNFVSQYQINSVTIQEKFNPLIDLDMTWNNSLITKFAINKDRSLSFALTNTQLTEVTGQSYVVGIGYTINQVKMPFELRAGTPVQSDLRLMADIMYRKTETVIRKAVGNGKQISAGQRNISVKITADYKLSDKLNMRAFYDFNKNNPIISTTFPTSTSNFGVTLMFTLAP